MRLSYSLNHSPPCGDSQQTAGRDSGPRGARDDVWRRVSTGHPFLPIVVEVQTMGGGQSLIRVSSPFPLSYDVLVRFGNRCWLVKLEPMSTGSIGYRTIPGSIPVEEAPALQVAMRAGDEN